MLKSPEVHRYERLPRKKMKRFAIVFCVLRIPALPEDLRALDNMTQISVLRRTDSSRDRTVVRHGIRNPVSNHGMLRLSPFFLEKIVYFLERTASVEIVRVDHGKRSIDCLSRTRNRMRCPPGLCPALRHAEALREPVQFLKDILHIKVLFSIPPDPIFKVLLDLMLDDKDNLCKSCPPRIIQRKIDNLMPFLVHWRDLLQAAKPRSHSSRQDH